MPAPLVPLPAAALGTGSAGLQQADRLHGALSQAGVVVWAWDPQGDRIELTEAAARCFGFVGTSLTVAQWRERLHTEDADLLLTSGGDASARQTDLRWRRPDGSWGTMVATLQRPSDAEHGVPPWWLGIGVDVTAQRRAAQELRTHQERAALAARGAGIGTWVYDPSTRRALWDEQMWRLRGLAPRGPSAPTLDDQMLWVHPDDRQALRPRIDRALQGPGDAQYEFRIVHPDGGVRWLASRSAILTNEEGQVVGRVGVNWDVTAQREPSGSQRALARDRRQLRLQAALLDRLGVALREPLNAVHGLARLARQAVPAPALQDQRLQKLDEASHQLLDLLDELLVPVPPQDPLRDASCDLVALRPALEELTARLSAAAQAREVQFELTGNDVVVRAPAEPLRQLLRTLLLQCLHRAPAGRIVKLRLSQAGGSARLSLDPGAEPLPEGTRTALRQPSADPADWLGLTAHDLALGLAELAAERLGASLLWPGDDPAAAGLQLSWPAEEDKQAVTAPSPPGSPAAPGPALHALLYVEDNPVNALIVTELVKRRPDLQLHVAVNGTEGVALARSLRPALVLLDMQLPDIDGYEVLRQLRASAGLETVPVIALSANAMPHDIERALRSGLTAYWTKPLDFKTFERAMDAQFGPVA